MNPDFRWVDADGTLYLEPIVARRPDKVASYNIVCQYVHGLCSRSPITVLRFRPLV